MQNLERPQQVSSQASLSRVKQSEFPENKLDLLQLIHV